MTQSKIKVLFLGEAVTLAHVARPFALASGLDAEEFEIHFACAPSYDALFNHPRFIRHSLDSISSAYFLSRLHSGLPPYDLNTLRRYIADDLKLIDNVKPDLIVGDFRLSLTLSAPLARIPHIALANAYWSPEGKQHPSPMPDTRYSDLFGRRLTKTFFSAILPLSLRLFSRPVNRLRKEYGLRTFSSLGEIYTHGDHTFFLDVPALVPIPNLPQNQRFLGPVSWSPNLPLPVWWEHSLRDPRPLVYVCLGSSGKSGLLPEIIRALSRLPVQIAVATAGNSEIRNESETIGLATLYASPFLPGDELAQRACLVICNGGSPSVYQALRNGTPVLGLATNLDQFLSMSAVERWGAGKLLASSEAKGKALDTALNFLIHDKGTKERAADLQSEISGYDAVASFGPALQGLAGR